MSTPKNIQRDGAYCSPESDVVAWSPNPIGASLTAGVQAGLMSYDYGYVFSSDAEVTLPDGGIGVIGVLIEPPRKDRLPYRVKASVLGVGMVVIGYGPAAPAGGTVAVTNARYIPFSYDHDDLIIVEPEDADDDDRLPLFIGVAVYDGQAGATPQTYLGSISVQNLGIKPPTMQNAVS